ncbi:MAG: hypothetical protein ACLSHC_10215 [Bilophila wadsworthia]
MTDRITEQSTLITWNAQKMSAASTFKNPDGTGNAIGEKAGAAPRAKRKRRSETCQGHDGNAYPFFAHASFLSYPKSSEKSAQTYAVDATRPSPPFPL